MTKDRGTTNGGTVIGTGMGRGMRHRLGAAGLWAPGGILVALVTAAAVLMGSDASSAVHDALERSGVLQAIVTV